MKTILRHQIERLFNRNVYNRGLKYYQEDRVSGLSFNRNNDTWFAEVHGSEKYFVEVNLSKLSEGRVITYCDCPAFETYDTCKHVAAVMFSISDEEPAALGSFDRTQAFLNGITNNMVDETNILSSKLPMKVEYLLKVNYDKTIWLEWKTGIEHLYIVRNVRDFLDHVLSDQPYMFTKKFTYQPSEHYFLQQDLEIFKLLASYIVTGDAFTNKGYFFNNSYDKRSLLVPPIAFKQLLSLLESRQTSLETTNQRYDGVHMEVDSMPYYFTVDEGEGNSFLLKIEGKKNCIYFEDHQTVLKDGIFYFPSEDQLRMIKILMKDGNHLFDFPINGDNKDRFFSEALPVLKKTSAVEISSKVTEDIVEYPLTASLYLENKDDMIIGNLVYHYGPYEVDPFKGNDEHKVIIVRDTAKEQQIMHLIEESDFHYNGDQLYISLDDDEEVYDFLYTILPHLDEYVELFLTKDIQGLILDSDPIPTTTVSVTGDSNLLEIGFDISGINDEEVDELLQAVIEKKRFYRLENGALVSLENQAFQNVDKLFDELNIDKQEIKDGMVHVPVYQGVHVDEIIDKKKYDPAFHKLLHSLKHPEEQIYPVPELLEADLRSYQEVGYQWFKSLSQYHLGGILADDMGLGKTLQTICYLLSEPSNLPHLIIVPSSVIYNWRNEMNRFAPSFNVEVISGTPDERQELISQSGDKDVWITSYGTLRQDIQLYDSLSFATMILDEAQFIKNYQTKTSKAVRSIHAARRFALSGTPIENSVDELWAIFQVIIPGLLPSLKEFRQMEPKRIASLTKPFILRRIKSDVLKELPEKIESVHTSELTKEQKDLYVGYLRELQEMASASIAKNSFQQNRMKILAGLTRLRQLCCHPAMFIENYEGRSGKLDELIEQVQTMLSSGRRLLIFSQFTSMHDLVIKELEKLDIGYFYLQGKTPAKERVEMSESFNNGEKDVFLISLKAGGTGLNLTGADTVILLDLWWNPAVEDQAAGRAHRFGQKKVVQVIRFITEGTIEEKIYQLQQKKRELINQIIQPGETMLSSLSEDDIKELLSI